MPADYQLFRVDDLSLAYTDTGAGAGEPLLLVHGFGACKYTWRHVVPRFSSSHRVLTLDLKGFGDSDKPRDDAYALADQARLVARFIEDKGLKNLTLAGHSMGGGVALLTYLTLADAGGPNPIARLVLIDSASYPQHLPSFIRVLRMPLAGRLALGLLPCRTLANWVLKLAFYDHSRITPEMAATYGDYACRAGADHALIQTARSILPENIDALTRRYEEITIPTLVLWGEEDRIVPLTVGRQLAAAIPTARLVTLPRCGHVPQEERPEETLEILADFLADRP